ncbi:MAG: NADH:ubiquinone reductase (Na(+)-transporting) subunit F [Bacteroidetes bacterium GWE2_41_25]|nr:MAG: NADH:ubiquinone reductase (Na(+)-transporting) subunit F [Bacteroidetes bacterium GWA2_40_15]OFX95716.1 MAG: NADH:ubiquinone reductase (Na(+)-transporting) subunit F [Bacteroidetes bacterium GWC2_40_22]OFY00838.1 MAG: NADH:ubiquinone reductase (Na(+)-transporting) subunit F [Bacteroidetes bacterium GWE2_41_25]HBH83427.1 NADH:ubiquinone reductase (Na(+)-transporting) subunit F [Bacteroidales bacterium]HBQ82909.1 NADH:ubiquinone reductase (Na(+)-transporting) subunit F [Bacteroidales bact
MVNEKTSVRDYSLIGTETPIAIKMGLADAKWYHSPVSREEMRELLVRKDGPAIRDTIIWFSLIISSGYLVFQWWGSWFVIFPYFIYSVLYASTSDSRWHESSHGTAFKTDWMNNVLYEIASFMVFRQSTVWRWSHARHHSDTLIRGRDPEIAVPRPPKIRMILLAFVGIRGAIPEIRRIFLHATGRIDPEVATYLPVYEYSKVIFKARIYIGIYLLVIAMAVLYRSILPLMFVGFPTLFGGWLLPIYGLTQHAALQENVLDHRLNCRTVYMNRIHRYLYWNMNYHVEHHMYPLVPYHALPKLHKLIKDDCPEPYKSITDAFREIIPAILKQAKDPSYFVERRIPEQEGKYLNTDRNIFFGKPDSLHGGKIEVCQSSDIPGGEVVRFDFQQQTYAVYRTEDNDLYATDGFCTHGNAHLAEGVVIGKVIECAKHNGRFNIKDGSPARMPVSLGVKTYPVENVDDKIVLDLSGVHSDKLNAQEHQTTFKVVSNKNVATFIKELTLEPLNAVPFPFQPGQYIKISIPPHKTFFSEFQIEEPYYKVWNEMGLLDIWAETTIYSKRNYSMATNPAIDSTLKFNLRIALPPAESKVSAGVGSSYVFNLRPGDEVQLTGPFGDFLIKKSDREMVYLGGGAGMAPLRSHLSYLFETERTGRKVSFWYGARSVEDIFYDDYFVKLEQEHRNFSFHPALSEIREQVTWNGHVGFIHEVLLAEYLSKHENPQEIEYYLCGPPAMIRAGMDMLKNLGVGDDFISFDEF